MKYFNILLIFATILVAGSVNAQSASKLNGKSFTYVLNNTDGSGGEVVDKITFANNQAVSEKHSGPKSSSSTIIEKPSGNATAFEVTIRSEKAGVMKYTGEVNGNTFYGTVTITQADGTQITKLFRGMTTEEFDRVQKEKGDYQQKQN